MTANPILTPEGKKKLKAELSELSEKRKAIIDRIAKAKELGDLSENAEYHAAREEQAFNEGKIQELEHTLKTANVVEKVSSSDTVQLGATVTVSFEEKTIAYTIVGTNESSVQEKKIAIDSPVAKALIGRQVGDSINISLPSGVKNYKVISIK